ncbi:MAG TPA: hypothetical protein VG184_12230 [Acidimicrobiales bacterium]|nr:hypothetical protein [Acidimicrobiales bacterium]
MGLRDLADRVAQQNSLVRSVGADSESIWVGPAAAKFRPHVGKLAGQLDVLTRSYHDAADALDGFWPRLRDAQDLALQALYKAQGAQGAIGAAQGQVASANASANAAAGSYNQASLVAVTGPPPPSPAAAAQTQLQIQTLQAGYQQAQSQVSVANAALGAANAQMAAAHTMKDTAVANAHTASSGAAAALHQASAAGIQNPVHHWYDTVVDGLDDVGHLASGAFHWVEHHEGDILTVAAVMALGPAGALLTPEGRSMIGHALEAVEPELKIVSGVLGVVSFALAIVGFVPALGEIADLANEGVLLVKTGADLGLLADGYKGAVADLAGDGLGLATGGESRILAGAGDMATADKAASELTEATSLVTSRSAQVADAEAAVGSLATKASDAEAGAALTQGISPSLDSMSADLSSQAGDLRGAQSAAQDELNAAAQAQAAAETQLSIAQDAASQSIDDLGANPNAVGGSQYAGLRPLQNVQAQIAHDGGLTNYVPNEAGGGGLSALTKPGTWAQYYKGYLTGPAAPYHFATYVVQVPDTVNEALHLTTDAHAAVGSG